MFTNTKISRDSILQILDDLDWHNVNEFFELTEHIAPEIACRAYLRAVPSRSKQKRVDAPPHVQIKYGRRRIIDECVRSLKKAGIIEVQGRGVDKIFRLINANGDPRFILTDCPCCGAEQPWIGQSGHNSYLIQCTCGLNISRETKLLAIRAWNIRNIIDS